MVVLVLFMDKKLGQHLFCGNFAVFLTAGHATLDGYTIYTVFVHQQYTEKKLFFRRWRMRFFNDIHRDVLDQIASEEGGNGPRV